jgi:hypothetical protein
MDLSEDDIVEILKLFERSNFDFLQLQHGERMIIVSKGGYRIEGGAVPAARPTPLSRLRSPSLQPQASSR